MAHVLVSTQDGVMRVTLNRPEKKNALTRAMYDAMADALRRAAAEDAVRVVLLTGSGDSYTAGNDLGDFQRARAAGEASGGSSFGNEIVRFGKPVVAAVNGLAIGIGATMLLHCDLVYASETARLRFPFVDLGLVPELASSLLLPRLAGYQRAAEILLLGDFFSAEDARAIGLVNAVLPPDRLLDHALGAAHALATKPANALRQTKALLRGDRDALLARKSKEEAVFDECRRSPEAQAIFAGFFSGERG